MKHTLINVVRLYSQWVYAKTISSSSCLPLSSSKCLNYTNNFPNFNFYCLYNYYKNLTKLAIGKNEYFSGCKLQFHFQSRNHFTAISSLPSEYDVTLSHFHQVSTFLIYGYREFGRVGKGWEEAHTLVFLFHSFIFPYKNCFYLYTSVELIYIINKHMFYI